MRPMADNVTARLAPCPRPDSGPTMLFVEPRMDPARSGSLLETETSRREDRLDSWKEIAAYLNRSVRTLHRWEKDEGLPVHRHQHKELGSVFAYKSELDAWVSARSPDPDFRAQDRPDCLNSPILLNRRTHRWRRPSW